MRDAGYDYTTSFYGPGSVGTNHVISELKRKHYDGVMIGFGVRGNPDLTVWFEEIVNIVREHAPHAKFMFNADPQSSLEAAKRWFPIA